MQRTGGRSSPEVTSDRWFEPSQGHVSSLFSHPCALRLLDQFSLNNVHKGGIKQHNFISNAAYDHLSGVRQTIISYIKQKPYCLLFIIIQFETD